VPNHDAINDQTFLRQAIELSRHALEDEGKTPFGALVVIDNQIIGEGTSSVIELRDPSAHAEIMALRHAGQRLNRHLMPDATIYCSSQPCPMCLIACYWARLNRVVYAATIDDTAINGFRRHGCGRRMRCVGIAAGVRRRAGSTAGLRRWWACVL